MVKEVSVRTVSWFSAGVSSAVATKLAIRDISEVLYTHIDDQHPDTMRFVKDCEVWFGVPVQVIQSRYKTVSAAVSANGNGYMNGPHGAPCRRLLKARPRKEWEREHKGVSLTYVWGYDYNEQDRAERLVTAMPEFQHRFPLIEARMSKEDAHAVLRANGIKRPVMYDLGYHNNNCIGCLRGGMGYWNRIRVDFPDVFEARAKQERLVGGTCIKGVYLDQLDPNAGRDGGPIVDECGIACELMRREFEAATEPGRLR